MRDVRLEGPGHARHAGRTGYTLTEMLIVIVIVGSLALFTLPRFSGLNEASKLAAARKEVEAAIATARAAAIQKGRPAQFSIAGNLMLVSVDTSAGGQRDTIVDLKPLNTLYKVTVSSPTPSVTFDPRGWVTTSGTYPLKFVLTSASRKDSVCFMKTGQILPRGCKL
ncbi:MAG TPA: GspH/FimT family pseudopilin [Gemmatimonadaceae bacterium]|nr:GspH/FimT family pseudopilin [Gemmatimonadaceae bacterium]